ncbi:opacity protein-like surface antigen [Flavobacterium sp. 2755]|uniref:porin family protein n=1 Tax=Flavobacterium sp. 2755 TaxID=2817765 RepID=UPI0028614A33|nr:porin family protein [Flavobacterium sp. 2755]MDR6762771.1 opacity protein-like surface antigen [Flavobacterium sp. 2755]
MKKVILSAIAVMAFGMTNAQDVKFGLKGGLNASNFSGDTEGLDFKSRFGFNVGGFAEIKFSEKFAIQPEVLYSTQGAKVDNFGLEIDGLGFFTGDASFNFAYINVPVMFKYFAAEKFSLEAGPQIGFLVSAELKTKVDGYGSSTQDIKDNFESIDFGLNLGAGYDFTENFFVGARYNLGLANIAKTEEGDDSKLHNGVFSLSAGYKF